VELDAAERPAERRGERRASVVWPTPGMSSISQVAAGEQRHHRGADRSGLPRTTVCRIASSSLRTTPMSVDEIGAGATDMFAAQYTPSAGC